MFNKKKTGIELLKEKLENANKEMIEAVEHLKKAREVHDEFYKLLFEVERFEVMKNEQNNTNN